MNGKEVINEKLQERDYSIYQLAKAMGTTRQNLCKLLRTTGDARFETVSKALAAMGYKIEVKDAPYRVVERSYIDYVQHKGRPAALFVAEKDGAYYVVDNREGGCYYIAFDQSENPAENKIAFESWIEKAT
jgi:hypothetical protein